MTRLPHATFALLLALLPARATVVGVGALRQVPTTAELAGIALVVCGVAAHEERAARLAGRYASETEPTAA